MITVRPARADEEGKPWKVERDGITVAETNCLENAKLYSNILQNRERRNRKKPKRGR